MNSSSKVIVVTGAGSGIGKAVARLFVESGYGVVLTGRNPGKLKFAAKEFAGKSDQILCVAGDVGEPDDVDNLFERSMEAFGRVDVLFNNAGIAAPGVEFDEISVEDWNSVIATNITGSFLCARKAFGLMKKQEPMGGRIINNGSISAYVPRPNSAPYTVSKHAISGLTRSLALDGRRYNIACGQIDIGNAESEMTGPMDAGALQPNGEIMKEPLMDVEHVASSVLHMAELPLDANVLFMNVMATKMPFVGRG